MTLRLERADRRRLAIASALTVAVLPAVWLVNRDDEQTPPGRPNVAAVGLAADESSDATAPPTSVDPMGDVDPMFLDEHPAAPVPEHVSVEVGTTEEPILGTPLATYSRSVGAIDACEYNGVPAGTVVQVMNPENGRSVDCLASPGDRDDLVLHPDRFVLLADLTSAPVKVEVRD